MSEYGYDTIEETNNFIDTIIRNFPDGVEDLLTKIRILRDAVQRPCECNPKPVYPTVVDLKEDMRKSASLMVKYTEEFYEQLNQLIDQSLFWQDELINYDDFDE